MGYTEFYCDAANTGGNVNSGSTTSGSSTYTATNGGWNSGGTFTPTAGNPSLTVSIGDFASVYTDGAATTGFVSRVTGVTSTTITVSTTVKSGTAPTTAGTGISCKVGGAWQGPTGAVGFPFGFVDAAMTPTASIPVRVNFKSGTNYAINAAMTHAVIGPVAFWGYTTTPGDGGRATIDGGSPSTAYILLTTTSAALNIHFADLIFQNNGTTTSQPGGLAIAGPEAILERVSVIGIRGHAITMTGASGILVECEGQTTATGAGFFLNTGNNASTALIRCVGHDCTGGSGRGFWSSGGAPTFIHCIADKNADHGFYFAGTNGCSLISCDSFNNAVDGFNCAPAGSSTIYVENSNFSANGGYGINVTGSASHIVLRNNGFGSGSFNNTSGQVGGSPTVNFGAITYSGHPYTSVATSGTPRAGNFVIADAAAKGDGRGNFVQAAANYSSTTTGFPDVGAGQHADVGGGGGLRTISLGGGF